MQVTQGGVSVWHGTPDAPAPSGVVAAGGDTSVTVGIQPPDHAASITVLYRINHGAPLTVAAQPTHHDTSGKQYFQAHLTGFKAGDKVEYVPIYRSGTRQIPSNQEAESHVATFILGPESAAHTANVAAHDQHGPAADDPREALRAILHASGALKSASLENSFIQLYFAHNGQSASFWQDLQKHADLQPHVQQLQFALQLDVLTSGHVPLIEALANRPGVKSTHDLAELDDSVWHDLIAKSGVPPQIPGSTPHAKAKFYAGSITATLHAAFPTIAVRRIAAASRHVDPLAVKFIENSPDFDIRASKVDAYADHHAATAFKGIDTAKRAGVIQAVKRLQRLFAASPNPDVFRALIDTNFDSAHAIAMVPRGTFVSQYGHLFGGPGPATKLHERAQFINARNINLRTSIHDALQTPPTRGMGHHSQAGQIRVYGARKANLCPPPYAEHPPAHHDHAEGSLSEDLVTQFPNSDELFGSIAVCNCAECESAIGPSAYLVDVLDFLGASKPNDHRVTPLDVLIGNPAKRIVGRRPDLAYMKLTCANTLTALPYIDIVNEVLESFVALGLKLDASTAKDSAGATSAELDANPQFINQVAYGRLEQAVYPFSLPFNRPLTVARAYLDQLGTSRHDVLKTFHKDQSTSKVIQLLAAEFLNTSAEEFRILTGHEFGEAKKTISRSNAELFGFHGGPGCDDHQKRVHEGSATHELASIATFQQKTGLAYAEVRALVGSRFVSPDQPAGAARELLLQIPVSHSALATLIKSNLSRPSEAIAAIEGAGKSLQELTVFKGGEFERIAKMVVIDDAGATCDPSSMKLIHFDGSPLDEHAYGRMHRFIRLYRKMGWSIADLDRAILALHQNAKPPRLHDIDISPQLIVHLAHIKQLQARYHITNVQVLLALWAPIQFQGTDSLYRGLFLNKSMHHQGVDPAFEQEFPDSPVLIDPQATLADHLAILQSAARISANDMRLLLDDCGFNVATGAPDDSAILLTRPNGQRAVSAAPSAQPPPTSPAPAAPPPTGSVPVSGVSAAPGAGVAVLPGNAAPVAAAAAPFPPPTNPLTATLTPLSLENVSALYRRAALAKALKLKIRDFLALTHLCGIDPFSSPEETFKFATLAEELSHSGLTAAQMSYVARHLSIGQGTTDTEPRDPTVFELARTIRDGLAAIARDNVVAPDPTGSLTAQKLALLLDSDVVDGLIGIINGTVNYSAPLAVLPASAAIPSQLAKKVTFDPIAQFLYCKSPLTAMDKSLLLNLSDDPKYHRALESLYQQPLDFIKTVTDSFLKSDEAQKILVIDIASLDAGLNPILVKSDGTATNDPKEARSTAIANKFAYVLQGLVPYVTKRLGASLVKTTISQTLKISDLMTQRLVDTILKSRLDESQFAIHDLYAVRTPGLSAIYSAGANATAGAMRLTEKTVAFDGSKAQLPQPATMVSWRGLVAPISSGDYEFILQTNGTPTIWVGDATTPLDWGDSSADGEFTSVKIALKARQLYYIRVEVIDLPTANGSAALMWQSAAVHRSVVPETSLYPETIVRAFRETYVLLHKASVIATALKLTEDELTFLERRDTGLPSLHLNTLPVSRTDSTAGDIDEQAPRHIASLLRAGRLADFRRDLPAGDIKLTKLFASSKLEDALATLFAVTGWDAGAVAELVGPGGFNLSMPDFGNEHWPIRLKRCVQMSDRLGVSPKSLFQWSTLESDFDTLERIGQDIKKCVQAQYDAETWLTVAKPLNDKLRVAQRDALVAYLLPRMGLKDADQLFEYFLIDPEMGVCTETSRISLAHSSVQLFVQRCLMNLEDTGAIDSVRPGQIDSDQWEKWRKHYRYWQVNYEVLLWPENLMEQGLRDDKTPFFKALEGELTQNEITAENVETAYLNYLEKLQQVARLEIIGTFWQDKDPDTGDEVNTLHVFGRTFHAPHTYFYRTFVNFTTWTSWEEMQVTIEGDHVMPLIWNRRLYVFWPMFVKKAQPPDHPSTIDPTSKSIPVTDSRSFWEVSLAWTELRHNKWSSKQVSKNAFHIDPGYFVDDDPARYAKFAYSFKTSITRDPDGTPSGLVFRCMFHGPTITVVPLGWLSFRFVFRETTEVVGAFAVGGCNGESVEPIFGTMPWPNPIEPPETDVEALTFVRKPDATGLSLTKAANQQTAKFLTGSPSTYRLLCPHQYSDFLLQAPFFYQDKHSTFFVSPQEPRHPVHQLTSASSAAFYRTGTPAAARAKAADAHAKASSAHGRPGSDHGKAGLGALAAHAHPARHPAPSDVSPALVALEKSLLDISEPYSKHASGRRSAWDSHALGHNTYATSATQLKFETFYHPFVCEFMKSVTRLGIDGLLTQKNQSPDSGNSNRFAHQYKPTDHVAGPYPTETVDFDNGPYAIYNRELFFHIPDLIAERLLQNKRHDEAIRYLKYIFDPTDHSTDEAPPARYWKFLPFKTSPRENIQKLLAIMESGDQSHSQLIADWAKNPFQPYAIARHRPDAYKKNIFIKYVRTHIHHGDALFLTDSKEAINEAHQHYIMASHLLGPKLENIPPQTKPTPQTYATLRQQVDQAVQGMALLENQYPFTGHVTSHPQSDSGGMQGIGRTLYFCAPKNAKLLELWDIVEDRLYKIRNCLNFEGVFRQLPLFDPPIDPALLVRAAARGIDLGSVLSDMQSPLPAYRFSYMLQKAMEMCNECRSFGGALLSALEKNDGETLAVMRSTHEVGILDLMHRVKIRQLDEANAQADALNASRNTAAQRYSYYQTLIGASGSTVPAIGNNIPLVPVPSQPSAGIFGIQLIPEEGIELTLSTAASVLQAVAAGTQAVATPLSAIPQISANVMPLGGGATITEGGQQLGPTAKSGADTLRIITEIISATASLSGKMGSYFRRQADWTLQNNLAACELMQIDRQIAAANIRVEIAQHELKAHEKQMENAQAIVDYMTNQKFTNTDLYGWMVNDLSSSYFACYQMAFAIAKKAERTFRFELGLTDSHFIQFGYWDSLRKGLLAGDRLHLALLQMEAAYTDQNKREYEISRDYSLLLNAPLALIALKETGKCEFSIPESFFDADYPGQFMRRIRSVSLTIPCVVGPYTSVNCTLTLLTNKIRLNASGDSYAEDVENGDARFANNFAAAQSIATSHGINDAGLFELNFRDERYLPFEGAGVIARWRLEMPKETNAFDTAAVSDVILHHKFVSKDGGLPLRQMIKQDAQPDDQEDLLRLFSLRHEFPSEWNRFLNPTGVTALSQSLAVDLSAIRFPYHVRGKTIVINAVELFLKFKDIHDPVIYSSAAGTPLGDYASAKPLKISLTPPGGGTAVNADLKSSPTVLNGVPHGNADVSDQSLGLGIWAIDLQAQDIAKLPASLRVENAGKISRLRSETIMDMFMLCHYSASS